MNIQDYKCNITILRIIGKIFSKINHNELELFDTIMNSCITLNMQNFKVILFTNKVNRIVFYHFQ